MTVDDLIAQGRSLARDCLLLSATGDGDVAGYWGGERNDFPDTVPPSATAIRSYCHVVTVDARCLDQVGINGETGTIGLRIVETTSGQTGTGVLRSPAPFSTIECDGVPLFAKVEASLPPFAAICLYGDASVAAWLASLGLERHQYVDALQEPQAEAYEQLHFERGPLGREDADVVIGGWHEFWMDDDFYLPLDMRLCLLTLRDAEPWYEMLRSAGHHNWSVREHIS